MAEYPFATALVTGASSGIGEEIVRRLAAAGVETVVVARRDDRLRALADELDGIEVLAADLLRADGIAAVGERIKDPDRPIDLVVNNAGFGNGGPFHELDPARLDDEISLNVSALTWLSHAALSVMVPRGRGWLINVSSVASFQPGPGAAVYAATKAFVTSLSESLHEEVSSSGVHVTALCPGFTRTEFHSVSRTEPQVSGLPSIAWTSVEQVARSGLDDVVRNHALSVPGAQYKALTAISGVMPKYLLRKGVAAFQRR